ncbi:hypothetical protein F5146DRAFT_1006736 [Armillaria mellea]|nr:hypothetical protein F5146DRAFT_1006736 [Armillaria mellea]
MDVPHNNAGHFNAPPVPPVSNQTEFSEYHPTVNATMSADGDPPFTIDATAIGNVPWQSFTISYNGEMGVGEPPAWKTAQQAPLPRFHVRKLGMEDCISDDLGLKDITFIPVIAGSDKTTISVATGQNEYYLVYITNGIIHNNVRHAHRDGVSLLAFLLIPKMDHEHQDSTKFHAFCHELFHGSLHEIFESLCVGMETPQILGYGDGHYQQTIFGLGPYITNYPKQALLACIVQGCIIDGIMPFTSHFPHADIHELLSPDLLHQIIKGTFKDHLVTWVEEYIKTTNTPPEAAAVLADIDHWCISLQLQDMFLPKWLIDEDTLLKIDAAVTSYHMEREIFRTVGVRKDEIHSDESKHIKVVKEPWQCSSHFEALGQMLLINEHLDKLAATRVDFQAWGMLKDSLFSSVNEVAMQLPSPDINEEKDSKDGSDSW